MAGGGSSNFVFEKWSKLEGVSIGQHVFLFLDSGDKDTE
jgi:hypothetical protein